MPAADLAVFQAQTATLIPTDQDEGVFKDSLLATRSAWAGNHQLKRSARSATLPEHIGRLLAHGREPRSRSKINDEIASEIALSLLPLDAEPPGKRETDAFLDANDPRSFSLDIDFDDNVLIVTSGRARRKGFTASLESIAANLSGCLTAAPSSCNTLIYIGPLVLLSASGRVKSRTNELFGKGENVSLTIPVMPGERVYRPARISPGILSSLLPEPTSCYDRGIVRPRQP